MQVISASLFSRMYVFVPHFDSSLMQVIAQETFTTNIARKPKSFYKFGHLASSFFPAVFYSGQETGFEMRRTTSDVR